MHNAYEFELKFCNWGDVYNSLMNQQHSCCSIEFMLRVSQMGREAEKENINEIRVHIRLHSTHTQIIAGMNYTSAKQ